MKFKQEGIAPDPSHDPAPTSGYRVPPSLSVLPASWIPYAELMRLDRPAGFFAFYWHYIIGLAFAACVSPEKLTLVNLLGHASYFAIWVILLRGTVCTINDILDQDFDRQVARTRYRPIARNAVSTAKAWTFTVVQTVVGGALLGPLSSAAAIWGAVMAAMLSIYPLAKRVSDFPQVVLGFGLALPVTFCCAVLETDGFLQAHLVVHADATRLRLAELALYGAGVLWTIIFDTIYAYQDIEDDKKAGVRSLAICLEGYTKEILAPLACLQVLLLVAVGRACNLSFLYGIVGCCGAGVSLAAMLSSVNLKEPANCAWWFGPGSRFVGLSVAMGLLAEYLQR